MELKTNHPFTKSLFKTAYLCPSRLYYARHPERYADSTNDDSFLQALAEGGFQVGELAKYYEQVEVDLHDIADYQTSLARTEELLQRADVRIAEGAFAWQNCYVRADIIRKKGSRIDLIEVKAKAFHPGKDRWMGKRDKQGVARDWREYLYDLAFQKYVVMQAYPEYEVHAYLMMADKSRQVDVDHLNRLFKIVRRNGQSFIETAPDAAEQIAKNKKHILTPFDVDNIVNRIIDGKTTEQNECIGMPFKDFVDQMRQAWEDDRFVPTPLDARCFHCPYTGHGADGTLKDGRDECWLAKAGYKPSETDRPQVSELWGAYIRRGEWIKQGIYTLDQVTEEVMPLRSDTRPEQGLNPSERHWLQVAIATKNQDKLAYFGDSLQGDTYLDVAGLKQEMDKWVYPIHMIDFETTAVALPFYKNMYPYEQVAFQFSHHIIKREEDGTYTIRHAGQYLNEDVTKFPNFEFVRRLKAELSQDKGSIFRYASHENSILTAIRKQLKSSNEPDKAELMAFIDDITTHEEDRKVGARNMIDLLDIVKRYYYCYNQMHGSNSIKKVLPAVLNSSDFLKHKYRELIYGSEIHSENISPDDPVAWIKDLPDGTIDNPYHRLPSMISYLDVSEAEMQLLEETEPTGDDMTIANGGAALTAYNRLLFCPNTQMEKALRTALLRYCELDTMAMVFIWEYFYHEVQAWQTKQ